MLQSFEGIIDATGLCSLRQDGGRAPFAVDANRDQVSFWAVVDTHSASQVLRELIAGNRRRALVMLEASAVSLGSKLSGSYSRPNE